MGNRRDRKSRSTDPSAGIRALRLELLLREELNSILDGELRDQRFEGVVVTLVELSRDGSRARIWYGMNHQQPTRERCESVKLAFEHAASFLRSRLCDALPLKRMPELSFRHDPAALAGDVDSEMAT